MESEVIDRRMIREATLGLLVLTVLLGVLFVTIYLKARVLWATTDEDFLATPVNVYHLGQGNVLTPTKKPPLVPLPSIESNQMVDLGEMRTIPAERFADLHSIRTGPAGPRIAALDNGLGTASLLESPDEVASETEVAPGTGNFPKSPDISPGSMGAQPFDLNGPSNSNSKTKPTQLGIPSLPGLPEVLEIPDRDSPDSQPPKFPTIAPENRVPPVPNASLVPTASLPSSNRPTSTETLISQSIQASQRGQLPVPGGMLPSRLPDLDTVSPVAGTAPALERGQLPVPEITPASDLGMNPIDAPISNTPQSDANSSDAPVRRSHLVNVHAELDQVSPELSLPDHRRNLSDNSRPTNGHVESPVPPSSVPPSSVPPSSPRPDRNLIGNSRPANDQPELPVPPDFSIDDLKNSLRRVGLPPDMSIKQLSERLYGDPRYAVALMQLNHRRASSDGQFIPGTQIHYLPADMLAFVYPDLVEIGSKLNQNGEPSQEQLGDRNLVQPVAFQEAVVENAGNSASSPVQNHEPRAEWYVTQGGETVFEIAADHLDQASHYVELIQWNRSLLAGRYRPTDPLPKGLRLRLRP